MDKFIKKLFNSNCAARFLFITLPSDVTYVLGTSNCGFFSPGNSAFCPLKVPLNDPFKGRVVQILIEAC